jgi:hypothetical protein
MALTEMSGIRYVDLEKQHNGRSHPRFRWCHRRKSQGLIHQLPQHQTMQKTTDR